MIALECEETALLSDKFESSRDDLFNDTKVTFDGRTYQGGGSILLEADVLIRIALKRWRQVEQMIFDESGIGGTSQDVSAIRQDVVGLLVACRAAVIVCGIRHQTQLLACMRLLKNGSIGWRTLETRQLIKLTSVAENCRASNHVFEYFHMYLHTRRIMLSILYVCKNVTIGKWLSEIIGDVIAFSYALFNHICDDRPNLRLLKRSPFACTCLDKFWSFLFLLSAQICKLDESFSVEKVIGTVLHERNEQFALWLVCGLIECIKRTQCDNPPQLYDIIESKLKALNARIVPCEQNGSMLTYLTGIVFVTLERGQLSRPEPYHLLWELFNKHLNVLVTPQRRTPLETAKFIARCLDPKYEIHSAERPFDAFLHALGTFLRHNGPTQWSRFRGRIYCKLPASRLAELTDPGARNVIELFLALGETLGKEPESRLITLLAERSFKSSSSLVIDSYASLAVLRTVRNVEIGDNVCERLVQIANTLSFDRINFWLLDMYVEAFDNVMEVSGSNFALGQHALLGDWIGRYLKTCEIGNLCKFLDILTYNTRRIRGAGAWGTWEGVLKEYIVPSLRIVAAYSNAPLQAGELAALIDLSLSSESLLTFTNDGLSVRVVCQFLITVLDSAPPAVVDLSKSHETAILHAWTRCCLLNCDGVDLFTRLIVKIAAMRCLGSTIELCANNVVQPFCTFLRFVSSSTNTSAAAELIEQCMGRIDSWATPHVRSPGCEAEAIQMYTCVSLAFNVCPALLYCKNHSACLFNRLIGIFVLPTTVLVGNAPHRYVLSAMQLTWHVFVRGIYSLLAQYGDDAYLERTARDIVSKYVPLLSLTNSPVVEVIRSGDQNIAASILDRIASSFLLHSAKCSDDATFKALRTIRLAAIETDTQRLQLIFESTIVGILEVIMFRTSNRTQALDALKALRQTNDQLKIDACFVDALRTIGERHIAFYANSYFQFAGLMAQVVPGPMRLVFPAIKQTVTDVECRRGVGFDNTLRHGLDQLEMALR